MQLIRLPEVLKMTSLSKSSLYRRIDAHTFPDSVSLGGRSVAWIEEEVLAWIQARIEERDISQPH
ncbi:helix-turn-helix transcriptional regulator [Neptuniibacter sp. QD29_5]|uniref:helix-turn-helix transcriptional regulator n=1 Tax=Neptuniibacter sp. QD29_5 TaxID=3398207 RepID=UPI0039F4F4D0